MSKRLLSFLSLAFFCFAAFAQGEEVIIVGDSLSAAHEINLQKSWPVLLQNQLNNCSPPIRVKNISSSGDTTRNGLQKLKQLLKTGKPKVIILALGANDGLRGLALTSIEKNLDELIEMSQQRGAQVLLLEIKIPPNYGKEYNDAFTKIYTQLKTKHHVTMLPFFIESVALDKTLMMKDGLHPNEKAQPLLLKKIAPSLYKLLKINPKSCA